MAKKINEISSKLMQGLQDKLYNNVISKDREEYTGNKDKWGNPLDSKNRCWSDRYRRLGQEVDHLKAREHNEDPLAQKAKQIWDEYDVESNLEWESYDDDGEMYGGASGYATLEDEEGGEWEFNVPDGSWEYPDRYAMESGMVDFVAPDGQEGYFYAFLPGYYNGRITPTKPEWLMKENAIANIAKGVAKTISNKTNKFASQGFKEGRPANILEVLAGNGFKAVNMEKNEGYWVYYITRGDVPFSRHLQEPGGMPIEDLVEDINVFLEDNYRNLEAYEAEFGTGRGIPIVIRNRNYSGALPPRANNNVEGTEVDQITEMVSKVVSRVIKENFGMDKEMPKDEEKPTDGSEYDGFEHDPDDPYDIPFGPDGLPLNLNPENLYDDLPLGVNPFLK